MKKLYRERFLRNIGIMDDQGLEKIRSTSIAIGGLGLGGSIFLNLVRMGFEKFHVADPDTYELTNTNRQRLAKESTYGRRKDECLVGEALDINPEVKVRVFPEGVKPHNVDMFLKDISWVVDVVDLYAMADKLVLNQTARKRGLPVASCASVGFAGCVVMFDASTPSFEELTGISMEHSQLENFKNYVQFIAPGIPDYMVAQVQRAMDRAGHIPFIVSGVEAAAATAAAQIAGQVLELAPRIRAPRGIFMDTLNGRTEIFDARYQARKFQVPIKKAA